MADADAEWGEVENVPLITSPEYGAWLAGQRRVAVAEALIASQDRAPKPGERLVSQKRFFGDDPESTGLDPSPVKRADLNGPARAYMDRQGWKHERVDHYNVHAGRSMDLFGIFDFLAFGPKGYETIGVQVTSEHNVSARKKKIIEAAWTPILVKAGWRILVLGMRKDGGRWIGHEHWLS